jgi:hypothetical protein
MIFNKRLIEIDIIDILIVSVQFYLYSTAMIILTCYFLPGRYKKYCGG